MSTIKSSDEHLTLNADGSSKDIKFQANGVEKASISSAGAFTSTTIDATKLTGDLPAISGANLTGISSVGGATGVDFDDNTKARFGTGNDIEMYFDGSKFYVKNAGTHTRFNQQYFEVNNADGTESVLSAYADGAVTLRYNNSAKIETTSSGVTLSGALKVGNEGASNAGAASGINVHNHGWATMATFSTGTTTSAQYIHFNNPNGTIGNITWGGTSTSYNTSSDYRLKENVVNLDNATDRLKQLKPKRFNFIADDSLTVDGFLAHEVSNVVPEAISGTKDEVETWQSFEDLPDGVSVGDNKLDDDGNTIPKYQSIDQSKLVPLLVKTIQELEARIAALEA